MKTERSECRFTVKEYSDGQPWIAVELYDGLPGMNGDVGLELRPGFTYEQAKDVAQFLKDHIDRMNFTAR